MRRLAAVACAVVAVVSVGARAETRALGDTVPFAKIGAPGAPEGIYVAGDTVFVGTHATIAGNAGGQASKIFTFDRTTAEPGDSVTIDEQNLAATHGLLGMARDSFGRLYVLDRNPARVLRIDPGTGEQEPYATIPDLHPCATTAPPCSPTVLDEPAFPDYPAFDAAGNLYVTDLQAATIFRVRPDTRTAEIWFQDARLDGIFGPNGIAVRNGRVYFAMTGSQQPTSPGQGIIYSLPLVESPSASDLVEEFRFLDPAAGPDGFAFGSSGLVYVALAGSNQVAVLDEVLCVVEPCPWLEVARYPQTPLHNVAEEIPYDLPASIAFDGEGSLLVTNQSFFAGNPNNWAVLDVWVADTAAPLYEPAITP